MLCVIGAAPVMLFFGYIATFAYFFTGQGLYFAGAITDVLSLLLPVIWLLLISLLLLLDAARKIIWGILATANFGLASTFSFLVFAQVLSGTPVGSLTLWIVVPVFAGPILGLVGAVWALFWKLQLRLSQDSFDGGRSFAR